MSERIRVLLADDHNLVRAGVRKILEADPRMRVVAEAADGRAALAALEQEAVDVLVLDLSMPDLDGLEVLRRARKSHPDLRVLVLTMHADPEYVARAVEAGANGYLLKDSAVQDLVAGIEAAVAGRSYYSPPIQAALAEILRSRTNPRPFDQLTDREREVLRAVAKGLPTKEIASQLGISVRTVETHRANLMRKLDVRSVALLTQVAIREGLIVEP
jgi:RNA polymerase sigma factor (sigma-70 family)